MTESDRFWSRFLLFCNVFYVMILVIGNKNAQRAVGSACNKNPMMIIIPCHRVISKNGKLRGFAYGNTVKQKLLELENNA